MKYIAFVNGLRISGEFNSAQDVVQALGGDLYGTLVIRPSVPHDKQYQVILPGGIATPKFNSKTGAINCALTEINSNPTNYIEVKEC